MPGGLYYHIKPDGDDLDHEYPLVFLTPMDAIFCEDHPTDYGYEVLEVEAPRHYDNGQYEGVLVRSSEAKVVRRWGLEGFAKYWFPNHKIDWEWIAENPEWADLPHWATVQHQGEEGGAFDFGHII